MSHRITRLRVTNYRGIEELDMPIPETGAVIRGKNGAGKTSVLKAIRAALTGMDIKPDAIRLGHDRAEILVDLEDATVRRVITQKGTGSLSVEASGGGKKSAPQRWLTDLLGTSALDPIDLYTAKPKDRRAQVLAAVPLRATSEQVAGWIEDAAFRARALGGKIDFRSHGLEVCEAIRSLAASEKAEVSIRIRAYQDANRDIRDELAKLGPPDPGAPSMDIALTEHDEATRNLTALESQKVRAEMNAARSSSSLEAIRELDEKAAAHDVKAAEILSTNPDITYGDLAKEEADAKTEFDKLEALRDAAIARINAAAKQRAEVTLKGKLAMAAQDEATQIRARAEGLRKVLADLTEPTPSDDDFTAARTALESARAKTDAARKAAEDRRMISEIQSHDAEILRLTEQAEKLQAIATKMSTEAPAELLAAANGITGLTLQGDDILLNGVSMDGLSGREQLLFAVDVARRANASSQILVVDGLERVDAEAMPDFIKAATAGGYQLIGTRVDSGEVVLEAIEVEEATS